MSSVKDEVEKRKKQRGSDCGAQIPRNEDVSYAMLVEEYEKAEIFIRSKE